jgi:hypothetical protein
MRSATLHTSRNSRRNALLRHNWSPGYYGTSDDVALGDTLDEIAAPDADVETADA